MAPRAPSWAFCPNDIAPPPGYGARVTALRQTLALHRWAAAWLVALALAVRLIVPAGFMPMAGQVGLEICAGQTTGMAAPANPVMAAMPGMAAMDHGWAVLNAAYRARLGLDPTS